MFLPTILMVAIGASATLFYALALVHPAHQPAESAVGQSEVIDAGEHAPIGGSAGCRITIGRNGCSGRLSGAEAAELSSQIAGLTRAGLPLAQGLAALGEELPRGRLRRSMNDLATTLEAGMPLDQAVKARGSAFRPTCAGW